MRSVATIVSLLAIIALTLTFYLGWIDVRTQRQEANGQDRVGIKVTVDGEKAEEDLQKASDSVKDISSTSDDAEKYIQVPPAATTDANGDNLSP